MIAIIISITVSLSILLSAFVSFSPSFKSLIEGDFKRKTQESAWAYASKSGQLIERANSRINPPDNFVCSPWSCKETFPMREEETGSGWVDTEHICVEVSRSGSQIIIDNVTPSQQACP